MINGYVAFEIHGFCDASNKAYGACVYLRCQLPSMEWVANLLCGKSRVAPLKQINIPRLELCGAVLLSNLVKKVAESLEIKSSKQYFWTDLTIVLAWIRGTPTRWKTFVANRVSEIQTLSNANDWGHVNSGDNPADLLSRGALATDLSQSKLWWFGPKWLKFNFSEWNLPTEVWPEIIPEQCNSLTCTLLTKENDVITELTNRFSSLPKIVSIFAYVLRFTKNIKENQRQLGALLPLEIDKALKCLIIAVQKQCFSLEYDSFSRNKPINKKSKLLTLYPFIDDGLIRVGGRLRNASQSFDKKHPIILPSKHRLTKLIITQEHERLLHCGVQTLLCSIRERFWPISGRGVCKNIVRNCVVCFKANPKPLEYLMGDLAACRVNSSSPFANVGTDYGGPFYIKDRKTRGAKITKAYMCLFVCMSVKAVHIELVTELTTDAFMAAFRRFISRRGRPINIYSDNGTNYVGANNEIKAVYEFLKQKSEIIANQLSNELIQWHFIPAKSPSFGGI